MKQINIENYKNIIPQKGYIVIKEVEAEKTGLVRAGMQEGRNYAVIVCFYEGYIGSLSLGNLIVYDECEGQSLYRFEDKITDDKLIIIKEQNLIAKIN